MSRTLTYFVTMCLIPHPRVGYTLSNSPPPDQMGLSNSPGFSGVAPTRAINRG